MSSKSIVYLGIFVGSTLASGLASLLGFGFLSFTNLAISTVGSLLGFYLAFTITKRI